MLFFLNTSDEEIATTLEFDGTRYGLDAADEISLISWSRNGEETPEKLPAVFTKTLDLPMRTEHVYLVRSEHRSAGR